MKKQVFEPFFQVENNNTINRKTGTGIGLSLVKQLVEKHNGEVFIRDNETRGVTFAVLLPKRSPEMQDAADETVIDPDEGADIPGKKDKTLTLIVSDIVMPEMDGMELSKIIKQDERFCHIPIILLSATTNIQVKIEGLEYGADSYIEKPFSIAYLKAQINSLIENRKKIMEKFLIEKLASVMFMSQSTLQRKIKDKR
jgi:CheY-like chemotaxis protein